MDFWSTIWDAIWWFFTIFVFVAYLIALFSIISDLFRDRELSGVYKAIWLLFLIFIPSLTALVYLIFRGRGMGDRAERQAREAKAAADDYIRTVAGGPASEIAQAKQLLDSGTISEAEFQSLKQSALDGSR